MPKLSRRDFVISSSALALMVAAPARGAMGRTTSSISSSKAATCSTEPVAARQTRYWHSFRCAPKARVTSGGGFRPESCRLIW